MPVIYTLTDENNSCDICEQLTVPRRLAIDNEDAGKIAATAVVKLCANITTVLKGNLILSLKSYSRSI